MSSQGQEKKMPPLPSEQEREITRLQVNLAEAREKLRNSEWRVDNLIDAVRAIAMKERP